MGLFPGSERSPGGGHGNPLLENPMDSRSWWATVHRVAKSWTQLKQLSMHSAKTHPPPVPQYPQGSACCKNHHCPSACDGFVET